MLSIKKSNKYILISKKVISNKVNRCFKKAFFEKKSLIHYIKSSIEGLSLFSTFYMIVSSINAATVLLISHG